MDRSKLLLCLPPVLMDLVDAGLTLALQPAEYWQSHAAANEASPLWALFLTTGPAAFAASVAAYLALVCACIVLAPKRVSLMISVVVCLWHVAGAWSWTNHFGAAGYWGGTVFIALFGVAMVKIWEAAGWKMR